MVHKLQKYKIKLNKDLSEGGKQWKKNIQAFFCFEHIVSINVYFLIYFFSDL